jgi:O-antigen biosynthesis protein
VRGWVVSASGTAPREVRVRLGRRLIPCSTCPRPDLATHPRLAGPAASTSHFGFTTEFTTRPGLKHLVVEARFNDEPWFVVGRRLLRAGPRRIAVAAVGTVAGTVSCTLELPGDESILSAAPETHPVPVPAVRAIAFYLPQFHPISENDRWWGAGFTEWTNVRPARPRFDGHYQPHVPHTDLGYYDLNDATVMEKQAALARAAGIHGFCHYYYWFGGKRLLEMPLERMLADGRPDMPFCYCWANENWSRRWDGQESEILIAQTHTPEDDDAVIRDLMRAFRDPRYIRVEDRPLLLIYRPTLLPRATTTFARWRELCRAEGIGEIHLAGVKGFGLTDSSALGLDALVEFPPNSSSANPLGVAPAGAEAGFTGRTYDYREVRDLSMKQSDGGTQPLYRCVMPSWDNTARRKNQGTVFLKSSPGAYLNWLRRTVTLTLRVDNPEHRLVFINAWNEWAEGCHLEPDARHGYAWLNATRRALGAWPAAGAPSGSRHRGPILILAHDTATAGSQMVLLALLRAWRDTPPPFAYRLVCAKGGALRPAFEALCHTEVLSDFPDAKSRRQALKNCTQHAPTLILSNTVVNGELLAELSPLGVPVLTYCHELQKSIETFAPGQVMAATLRHSRAFLAASESIAQNLRIRHGVAASDIKVVTAAIDLRPEPETASEAGQNALAEELGIKPGELVVFGTGTTDARKGPDLFIRVAVLVCAVDPRVHFVWIGGDRDYGAAEIKKAGLLDRVHFLGPRNAARRFFPSGHLFALTSREDPCPLVALEAALAGLPVVCFEGAGDIPAALGPAACEAVPLESVDAFAQAVLGFAHDPERRALIGAAGRARVTQNHDIRHAALVVTAEIQRLRPDSVPPLVTVIVPNYNHARYLPERLASVANQTLGDIEIILLDDASTDSSRDLLVHFAAADPRARFVPNSLNSGSTFKQWRKGLRAARGKYIWIAESDDSAELDLLERLVAPLEADADVILACCQLRMMDTSSVSGGTPDDWLGELDPIRWKHSFVNDGRDEIARFLSRKNTILNASGVLFRNFDGVEELVDDSMRLCADWLFWTRLLMRGKIAYEATPLNHWRLQSSNARTRPPGDLEQQEGSRILHEIAGLLDLTADEREALLTRFSTRCRFWTAASLKTTA